MNILSKSKGVFSRTSLPSTSIAASFGGISTSFITLTSLLLPVLLCVLCCEKVTFGNVSAIPTLATCTYNKSAEVPVGTS